MVFDPLGYVCDKNGANGGSGGGNGNNEDRRNFNCSMTTSTSTASTTATTSTTVTTSSSTTLTISSSETTKPSQNGSSEHRQKVVNSGSDAGLDGSEEDEELLDVESTNLAPKLTTPAVNMKELNAQLQCLRTYVIEPLYRHPKSAAFRKPVDHVALGIPDYPKIITHPMDLGTIRDNIRHHKYASLADCLRHIDLVWKNAKKFNPPDHFIHQIAVELENFSRDKIAKIDFSQCKFRDDGTKTKTRRLSAVAASAATSAAVSAETDNNFVIPPAVHRNFSLTSSHHHHHHQQKRGLSSSNHPSSNHSSNAVKMNNSSVHRNAPGTRSAFGAFTTKDPLEACKEIVDELLTSEVHQTYVSPFRHRFKGLRLDLVTLQKRLKKRIYVHPLQVAQDFRSIITSTYRKYSVSGEEDLKLHPTVLLASQLQHQFEVMFARRVFWQETPLPDITDSSVYTQQLLLAQNAMLSIQNDVQTLFQSFYIAKARRDRRRKKKKGSNKKSSSKRQRNSSSPVKDKKRKVEEVWTRDDIIKLQAAIGKLNETHQQPILALMHRNGEKITEDEEGYVILDIEEASTKSLNDIKNYIESLPPVAAAVPAKKRDSDSSESGSDSSSESSDSSSDSSDDD